MRKPSHQTVEFARYVVRDVLPLWQKNRQMEESPSLLLAFRILVAAKGGRRWIRAKYPWMLQEPFFAYRAGEMTNGKSTEDYLVITRRGTPIYITRSAIDVLLK